jgi:hypothetical protein
MKKHWLAFLLTLALVPAFTGCVGTVDDSNKAGWPFSKDTIESRYPRSIDQLTVATREVLARNGTITSDDAVTRVVRAKVNNRTVYVKLEELEPQVTRVLVQVRAGAGSDINLASEIDKQIALQLAK